MKTAIICFALLALFSFEVKGKFIYGEKEDAIEKLNSERSLAQSEFTSGRNKVAQEKTRLTEEVKTSEVNHGNAKYQSSLTDITNLVKTATKNAIIKGKPLATFDCIEKTEFEAKNYLEHLKKDNIKNINELLNKKIVTLDITLQEINLMDSALTEIVTEATTLLKENYNKNKNLVQETLQRIQKTVNILREIMKRINNQSLENDFNQNRTEIEKKFSSHISVTKQKLDKC